MGDGCGGVCECAKKMYVLSIIGILPLILSVLYIMRGNLLLSLCFLIMGISFPIALAYVPKRNEKGK